MCILYLFLLGCTVVLACRDEEKGKEAYESIIKITKSKKVALFRLDLNSFKSIKEFVKDFKKSKFFSFLDF